ncbi:TPA: hypothetical protein I8649_001987 [Legionella pneumophila]|nr:hypothetical protein [Legionella pneumophila]
MLLLNNKRICNDDKKYKVVAVCKYHFFWLNDSFWWVSAGWHLGITLLLQYQYATIAMVYNTALSFTVLGLCIILLLFHYYKISQFLTTLIITLSFLVLLQTIFDINLHVDEFFLKHYYNVANYFPGRMAPNTTVSLIMAGVVIFIIERAHWTFNMGVLASVFTILLLFMSLLFASGNVSSLQDAYEWSQLIPMALNTALWFILLSLSLLFALLNRCQYHGMARYASHTWSRNVFN